MTQCLIGITKKLHVLALIVSIWGQASLAQGIVDEAFINNKVHEALTLMSQKRPAVAISILEPLNAVVPNNKDIAMTLASAYVGFTKVTMKDFIPLFRKIKENKKFSKELKQRRNNLFNKLTEIAEKNDANAKDFLKQWQKAAEITDQLMYVFEYLSLVPDITAADVDSISTASTILNMSKFEFSKGDATFAVLINLVLLKHRISTNVYFRNVKTNLDLSRDALADTLMTTDILAESLEGTTLLKDDLLVLMKYFAVISSKDSQIHKSIAYIEEHWSTLEEFLIRADAERLNLLLYCAALDYACM